MSSTSDQLIDRRRMRRRLSVWRALAFLAAALAVVAIGWRIAGTRGGAGSLVPHLARLQIGGLITGDRATIKLINDVRRPSSGSLPGRSSRPSPCCRRGRTRRAGRSRRRRSQSSAADGRRRARPAAGCVYRLTIVTGSFRSRTMFSVCGFRLYSSPAGGVEPVVGPRGDDHHHDRQHEHDHDAEADVQAVLQPAVAAGIRWLVYSASLMTSILHSL